MEDPITRPAVYGESMVRLTGTVAGVKACEVVTGSDEIHIGSATGNSLVVSDPLVPSRAFKLVRSKRHNESTHQACGVEWTLEAHPEARVFLNRHHTQRDKIIFGDTITVGCHQFVFSPDSPEMRDRRMNVNVADLCAELMRNYIIPPGFLLSCPDSLHRERLRKAFLSMGIVFAVLALIVLLIPREEFFQPVQQPPLEITMVTDMNSLPASDAVRSLDQVKRQTFTPADAPASPDLIKPQSKPVETVKAEPVKPRDVQPATAAPKLEAEPLPMEKLTPAAQLAKAASRVEVQREKTALSGAPVRRLSVAEAQTAMQETALRKVQVKTDESSLSKTSFRISSTRTGTAGLQEPVSGGSLTGDKSRQLAMMAALKPSPVDFEAYSGTFIPVVRISEQLTQMETGGTGGGVAIDGVVTTGEANKSWKSGRFRIHAAGSPPPEANPATYCYVSKIDMQGRQCLYISFVCMDPDVSKIIANSDGRDLGKLLQDDSVEVFLDVNFDRQDYHQIIVTAKDAYWTAYFKSSETMHQPLPWDASPTIKTSINKDAGQWSCEMLIPFDRLNGVPPAGSRWAVNFCRNFRGQIDDWQLQSWFEVYDKTRNFHHPSKFGVFQW